MVEESPQLTKVDGASNSTEQLSDSSITSSGSNDSMSSYLKHLDVSKNLKVGRFRASGGSADVYGGKLYLKREHAIEWEWIDVAVKRFRVYSSSERDFAKVGNSVVD